MNIYDDMPPLVEAPSNPQPNIPPPPGATFAAGHPAAPRNAHAGWNAAAPQQYPPFTAQSTTQDQWARWAQYWQATAAQVPPVPSPYIPPAQAAPFFAASGAAQPGSIKRAVSASAAYPPNPQQQAPQWNAPGPAPFHTHARPTMYSFPAYPSARSHTPTSAISTPRSSLSYVPPDWPGEPPKNWRRDFKFKSRFSSLFRSRSTPRAVEESTDSTRLCLPPILQYDRRYPPVILDLRRHQSTLVLRALDRHVTAYDLMYPTTEPPTRFMRLCHTRLPWYIDIVPSGNGSYVTLGDFFTTLCETLAWRICAADYYNDELDSEDRTMLTQAWDERCRDESERLDGMKRVDFLRGKYMFQGLTRGKNGMWQLRTGVEC